MDGSRYGRQPTGSRADEWLDLPTRLPIGDGRNTWHPNFGSHNNDSPISHTASAAEQLWQIPIQIRLVIGDRTEHRRLLLTE